MVKSTQLRDLKARANLAQARNCLRQMEVRAPLLCHTEQANPKMQLI